MLSTIIAAIAALEDRVKKLEEKRMVERSPWFAAHYGVKMKGTTSNKPRHTMRELRDTFQQNAAEEANWKPDWTKVSGDDAQYKYFVACVYIAKEKHYYKVGNTRTHQIPGVIYMPKRCAEAIVEELNGGNCELIEE